jgi:hypothetical protein
MEKTIPYTYKLIFKPTGQYYYGVRWAKGCNPDDLWMEYFTSSDRVKELIEIYGRGSFDYKVTKTFNTKEEAGEWESNLLKRVNAANNGKFINRSNNMPVYDTSGLRWIHHTKTNIGTFHDELLPLPEGWKYGQSESHKTSRKISWNKFYESSDYIPWNSGGGKPTGQCSEERRNSISKSRLNTRKIKCNNCGKETDPGNFKRFHGDNCKLNPNIDPRILEERSNKAKSSMIKQKENGTFKKPKPPVGVFKCPHCNKEGINYGSMKRHHFDRCKAIAR